MQITLLYITGVQKKRITNGNVFPCLCVCDCCHAVRIIQFPQKEAINTCYCHIYCDHNSTAKYHDKPRSPIHSPCLPFMKFLLKF